MNSKRGQKVRIQLVKYMHGSYVIKQTWKLEEIHRIDYYEDGNDTGFTIHFDRATITWSAFNVFQKNLFLSKLWKLCEDHLRQLPVTNIDILELQLLASDVDMSTVDNMNQNLPLKDFGISYKELTVIEEKQLEELISSWNDIDQLSIHLNSQLQNLEIQNIYEIIESEIAVKEVMSRLSIANDSIEGVDKWLQYYNSQLLNMKQYIEHIINKNNQMEVVTRNQKLLLDELEKLLRKFQLDENSRKILKGGSLAVGTGLSSAITAANSLEQLYQLYNDLNPQTKQMKAIK